MQAMEPLLCLTRQKSCIACVKAKRKCDRGLPACTRCSLRNLDCDFSGRPLRAPHSVISDAVEASLESFNGSTCHLGGTTPAFDTFSEVYSSAENFYAQGSDTSLHVEKYDWSVHMAELDAHIVPDRSHSSADDKSEPHHRRSYLSATGSVLDEAAQGLAGTL